MLSKRKPIVQWLFAGCLLWQALFAAHAQAEALLQIVPLGGELRVGCVRDDAGNQLTFKGPVGTHRTLSVHDAREVLDDWVRAVARATNHFDRDEGLFAGTFQRSVDGYTRALRQALQRCASGELFSDAPLRAPFEFLCLHGFRAPSAAVTGTQCGVNLGSRLSEDTGRAIRQVPWTLRGAATVLDELLGAACSASGGVYLRKTTLAARSPLYHGVCARLGEIIGADYNATARSLNMTQENTGCEVVARFNGVACGPYEPSSGGGGGGGNNGGGGGSAPAPTDCLIKRMTQENTGCE